MILFSLIFGISILYSAYCENQTTTTIFPTTKTSSTTTSTITLPTSAAETTTYITPDDSSEDMLVLNETITKYGLPQNCKELGLPGPEIATDDNKYIHKNKLEYNNTDNHYILKVRTITTSFSYNARYEESTLKTNNSDSTAFPQVKGQFTEHFERESGGFYIRTIGYTLDENGYKQFLLDLTVADTMDAEIDLESIEILGGPPGKIPISSTVLATLTGGNSLG